MELIEPLFVDTFSCECNTFIFHLDISNVGYTATAPPLTVFIFSFNKTLRCTCPIFNILHPRS